MALILYTLNGVLLYFIVWQLTTYRNQETISLRNTTIIFFSSLAWYQLGWAISIVLTGEGIQVASIYWLLVNVPFSLAIINLIIYLYKNR